MAFIFSLFTLGFTSLISQVILLRELMLSFYGNEFFLGLILAVWLIWVGLGSFFLAKLFKDNLKTLLSCHILIPILLSLSIILIRLTKTWTPALGQIPDLLPSLILGILIPGPLCLILGLQFTVSTKYLSVNKGYLIESLGFVLSGLIFSFGLIKFNIWLSIFVLAFLNYLAVLIITASKKYSLFKTISLILLFASVFLIFPQFNQPLEEKTQSWRLPHQEIIEIINSPHGEILISQSDKIFHFYQNGLWLGSSQKTSFQESLAHFSLLAHQNPKQILLIGFGFNGLIEEILKHNPDKITYLELDPWLIESIWPYLSLKDKRIDIVYQDGRSFLRKTDQKFDLIIINLPDPSTALINRFYTQEFFEQIKNHLNPSGSLTTYLSFSPNFQNEDSLKLESSIFQTLKKDFTQISILPEEDSITFLASDSEISSDLIIQKYKQKSIQTKFINPQYLDYVINNPRIKLLEQEYQREIKINQDAWPIAYAYNFFAWLNYFHPQLANNLRGVFKIEFWHLLIFLAVLAVFFLFKQLKQEQKLWLFMALAGFSLMGLEITLILAYQFTFGYLYYRLALIFALFMLGLALGAWLGIKIRAVKFNFIKLIHLAIILYTLALYYLLQTNLIFQESLFVISILIISGLVGLEFAFINSFYLKDKNRPHQRGLIYNADLIGSGLGAILAALFLIPLFGISQTLIFIALLNLLPIFQNRT